MARTRPGSLRKVPSRVEDGFANRDSSVTVTSYEYEASEIASDSDEIEKKIDAFRMFLLGIATATNSLKKVRKVLTNLDCGASLLDSGSSLDLNSPQNQINALKKELNEKMVDKAWELAKTHYSNPSVKNIDLVREAYEFSYQYSWGPKQSRATGYHFFSKSVNEHLLNITSELIEVRIAQQKKGKSTRLGKLLSKLADFDQEKLAVKKENTDESAQLLPWVEAQLSEIDLAYATVHKWKSKLFGAGVGNLRQQIQIDNHSNYAALDNIINKLLANVMDKKRDFDDLKHHHAARMIVLLLKKLSTQCKAVYPNLSKKINEQIGHYQINNSDALYPRLIHSLNQPHLYLGCSILI